MLGDKTALLFPGQGAQQVGMAEAMWKDVAASPVVEYVQDKLGLNLPEICRNNPDNVLFSAPYINLINAAISEIYRQKIARSGFIFTGVAGYSMGQFSALVEAGVFSFREVASIIWDSSRDRELLSRKIDASMGAIIGIKAEDIEEMCSQVSGADGPVFASNYNSHGNTTVSGVKKAVETILRLATERGAIKAVQLQVSGAWHCPLMEPAGEALAKRLESVEFRSPQKTYFDAVTAQSECDSQVIRRNLVRHSFMPVRWTQTIEAMVSAGYKDLVEVGYGNMLSKFVKMISRKVTIRHVDEIIS